MHLATDGDLSSCGMQIPSSHLTEVEDQVSCLSCQRHFNPTVRSYASKRGTTGYADAQFPGLGVLRCYLCDRPIRDHPVAQPCPFLDPEYRRA